MAGNESKVSEFMQSSMSVRDVITLLVILGGGVVTYITTTEQARAVAQSNAYRIEELDRNVGQTVVRINETLGEVKLDVKELNTNKIPRMQSQLSAINERLNILISNKFEAEKND